MALTKIVCPKCEQIYTATADSKYLICPLCGAPLFEGEEIDLPDLSVPGDIDSLQSALRHAFRLLYFRSYNRLLEFTKLMKELYPENYWSVLFELIGRTEIDFIFLIPKVDYALDDEEVKEDARARYYHYVRKKYSQTTQLAFNKIAGYYPDIPGNNKKKWNKARTKYEEKVELINSYSKVASIIREEYLEKLDQYASDEDQKNITYNIKIWLNQVAHAEVDLYRYNQSVENHVKDDYDRTPNPGNRPVFIGYVVFYLISLLTFVLSMTQIILSILNVDMMSNLVFLYFSASIFTVLLLVSSLVLFAKQGLFKKHPILAVTGLTILFLVCVSGIVTAGIKMRINWFAIFAGAIALLVLFYTSVKLVKYFPRKSTNDTIIGNFQKLSNNTFVIDYSFEFQPYQGEEPREIIFTEKWINGQ
ncbi:MAG: hypothetical protein IJQ67_03895 [Bacilli bacterium]|nr:hypothetical protein [Bacilli bacterium]